MNMMNKLDLAYYLPENNTEVMSEFNKVLHTNTNNGTVCNKRNERTIKEAIK